MVDVAYQIVATPVASRLSLYPSSRSLPISLVTVNTPMKVSESGPSSITVTVAGLVQVPSSHVTMKISGAASVVPSASP
jgi:hypothetical protein